MSFLPAQVAMDDITYEDMEDNEEKVVPNKKRHLHLAMNSNVDVLVQMIGFRLSNHYTPNSQFPRLMETIDDGDDTNWSLELFFQPKPLDKPGVDYYLKAKDTAFHFISFSGIALNTALLENVFPLLVCILNRIPIFLVGKPGCSKSLSMQLINANLRGSDSTSKLFKKLFLHNRSAYHLVKTFIAAYPHFSLERGKDLTSALTASLSSLMPSDILREEKGVSRSGPAERISWSDAPSIGSHGNGRYVTGTSKELEREVVQFISDAFYRLFNAKSDVSPTILRYILEYRGPHVDVFGSILRRIFEEQEDDNGALQLGPNTVLHEVEELLPTAAEITPCIGLLCDVMENQEFSGEFDPTELQSYKGGQLT
ncbi:hypothetical protein PROFUN_14871 [Planoprotostelium fungivorum]|uniref:Uncharacterized protein n=1 Tax=Planoprotostelium fungivorum TaxID=1890364 RepID=A0A2P6MS97_9EUKA|nr:hypothetical protein PROFUN_14871 [Planoprotostelium fungivorum]